MTHDNFLRKLLYRNYIITPMEYSTLVKRIRSELLVTQTELAEMLGVTFATVNRWERGHHVPTIKQKRALRELCRKKKISIED